MSGATPVHEAPGSPSSPLPKRTKYTEPAPVGSVAAILNEPVATPTPQTAPLPAMASVDPPLQVKLLSETAKAPTRGSAHAAGYDLYASKDGVVPGRGKAMIDTDISIAVPAGTYGRVAPRSGLAAKHSIDTGAGVIDADYRGPLKVILFNFSDNDFEIKVGDRIAQLIIERIYTPEVIVVEQLDETVRGAGGFGSTGGFNGTLPGIETMPTTDPALKHVI